MLGKFVRVRVTNPIHSVNGQRDFTYGLNYGVIEGKRHYDYVSNGAGAYIMGINHPVRTFDGRVIAVIRHNDGTPPAYVVAPKSTRFINYQVEDAVEFAEKGRIKRIECLYERSSGAIVYRFIGGELTFLLIKNNRSSNWGFPKGHIERGETTKDAARREVLEETGVHAIFLPDFASKSEYTIQGKVEKTVTIFLARTEDVDTKIQREEIEDYAWLNFRKAMDRLKFSNDRNMLKSANEFLKSKGIAV